MKNLKLNCIVSFIVNKVKFDWSGLDGESFWNFTCIPSVCALISGQFYTRRDQPYKAIIFRRQITPYLRYMTLVSALILTVTFLISCAVIQQPRAYETANQLAICGFKQKLANTPEKLDKLKELPQRKLILREHCGTNYYLYANAHQKCLFIGTEKAYQSYQKSEIQKQIVDNDRTANSKYDAAASAGRVEAFNWAVGDTWVPWMYY